ncbi:hypothetical protein LCGC14_3031840, partial [marine sediment metagenome]
SIGVNLAFDDNAPGRKMRILISRAVAGEAVVNMISGTVFPNDTNWHRVMFTYDQTPATGNAKVYIDGSLADSADKTAFSPSTANSSSVLTIGENAAFTAGQELDGDLSFLAIFDRVLTVEEADLWFFKHMPENAHNNAENGGMWYIGAQSPEHDYSGDGFDGTVTGTTLVDGPPGVGGKGMGVI